MGEPEFQDNVLYYLFLDELNFVLIRNGFSCSHAKLIMDETRKRVTDYSEQFEVISKAVEPPEPESLGRIAASLLTPNPNWGRLVAFFAYLAYLQRNSSHKVFTKNHIKQLKKIVKKHVVPWNSDLKGSKAKLPAPRQPLKSTLLLTAAASCLTFFLIYFRSIRAK
ncbi:A9 [Alcelaphine gammaherpesvirus 2]|uniref:A9 n=1 Tax=Alcelaphine gammaherpesvirus 2 TaxID=138184 RepID=A0A068AAN3_9GAMA|nr:A9 [Alcelaphine gammaherpesvirus 2]AIA62110.1 A9 [Alcelaphine gammaherpesvirus 2]